MHGSAAAVLAVPRPKPPDQHTPRRMRMREAKSLRTVWTETGSNGLVFILGQFGLGANGLRLLTV
jgi:hypothetical protein